MLVHTRTSYHRSCYVTLLTISGFKQMDICRFLPLVMWLMLLVAINLVISATNNADDSASGLVLKSLPYAFNALEPAIDEETMTVHWGKHHRAYTDNANTALRALVKDDAVSGHLREAAKRALANDAAKLQEALYLAMVEEQKAPAATKKMLRSLRNNGGGFLNHNEYFENLAKPVVEGGVAEEASGALGAAVTSKFGSWNSLREKFNQEGTSIFGSGWVWLIVTADGELDIVTTPNQDRPPEGSHVIIGCDVWEHAYYLKRQNRRQEYLVAFWNVVNYKAAQVRYEHAMLASQGSQKENL